MEFVRTEIVLYLPRSEKVLGPFLYPHLLFILRIFARSFRKASAAREFFFLSPFFLPAPHERIRRAENKALSFLKMDLRYLSHSQRISLARTSFWPAAPCLTAGRKRAQRRKINGRRCAPPTKWLAKSH